MSESVQTATRVIGARVPYPLHAEIEALCEQEHRTKSNMVMVLLEEALRIRQARDAERPPETDAQKQE